MNGRLKCVQKRIGQAISQWHLVLAKVSQRCPMSLGGLLAGLQRCPRWSRGVLRVLFMCLRGAPEKRRLF